eukprot:scaffold110681_cov14-Tisochrysis_lutea.AAC.1
MMFSGLRAKIFCVCRYNEFYITKAICNFAITANEMLGHTSSNCKGTSQHPNEAPEIIQAQPATLDAKGAAKDQQVALIRSAGIVGQIHPHEGAKNIKQGKALWILILYFSIPVLYWKAKQSRTNDSIHHCFPFEARPSPSPWRSVPATKMQVTL